MKKTQENKIRPVKTDHKQYGFGDSIYEKGEGDKKFFYAQYGRYEVSVHLPQDKDGCWRCRKRFYKWAICYHEHHLGWNSSYSLGEAWSYEEAKKFAIMWLLKNGVPENWIKEYENSLLSNLVGAENDSPIDELIKLQAQAVGEI